MTGMLVQHKHRNSPPEQSTLPRDTWKEPTQLTISQCSAPLARTGQTPLQEEEAVEVEVAVAEAEAGEDLPLQALEVSQQPSPFQETPNY